VYLGFFVQHCSSPLSTYFSHPRIFPVRDEDVIAPSGRSTPVGGLCKLLDPLYEI
jgi:hypothetical protein